MLILMGESISTGVAFTALGSGEHCNCQVDIVCATSFSQFQSESLNMHLFAFPMIRPDYLSQSLGTPILLP